MFKKQIILIISALLLWPIFPSQAATQGTFTENFKSTGRFEDTATYAFVNTKQGEVTLPLRYDLKNLALGLQGFKQTRVLVLGTDGQSVMVGGEKGALNLLRSDLSTEDISGLLNKKMKNVTALDFAKNGNFWLVGGEGTKRQDGAPLFKLIPGGLQSIDLQDQSKKIGLETIVDISCLADKCLLTGTPRKIALYDGANLTDLSGSINNLIDPIRIAKNGVAWLLVANSKPEKIYIPTAFLFDGQNVQNLNLPNDPKSTATSKLGAGWNGENWLVVRGQPFTVWQISGQTVQDLTDFVTNKGQNKISLTPNIGAQGKTWLIGGRDRQGLLAQGQSLNGDLSVMVPDLKNLNIVSFLPSPWGNEVLLGGSQGSNPVVRKLTLDNFASSAAIESKQIASIGYNLGLKSAQISADVELPQGTGIDFMLETKNNSWESFPINQPKDFINHGNTLKWRAVLSTNNPSVTPRLKKLTITYSTSSLFSVNQVSVRDARRISDLRQVSSNLKNFKIKIGSYPIVAGNDAAARWQQLEIMLKNSKIISAGATLPNDPLKSEQIDKQYNYLVKSDGAQYVLLTTLEDSSNKSLAKDLDGQPVQIFTIDYSCNDPIYCLGDTAIVATTPPSPSSPSSPSPTPVNLNPPANRLVKIASLPDIYYLDNQNKKRRLPTWQSFIDYGFKLANVATITPQQLATFGDQQLIKLKNDTKVWKIDKNIKHLIPSEEIFNAHGFNWKDINIVNWTEYVNYQEGATLK